MKDLRSPLLEDFSIAVSAFLKLLSWLRSSGHNLILQH